MDITKIFELTQTHRSHILAPETMKAIKADLNKAVEPLIEKLDLFSKIINH